MVLSMLLKWLFVKFRKRQLKKRLQQAFATTATKSKILSLSHNKPRAGKGQNDKDEEHKQQCNENFVHALLEKARWLQQLWELQQQKNVEETKNVAKIKAEAIRMEVQPSSAAKDAPEKTKGSVTLEFNPTQ